MGELIPIHNNDGAQAVMGRDLHNFLEVATPYKDWMPRMIAYGFTEGQDFSAEMSKSTGGRPRIDHIVSLDMAKEISMIQRTDKGKQARAYFLECERRAKQPVELSGPELMARAVLQAESTIKELEAKAAEDAPKVGYYDEFVAESDLIEIRTLANQLNRKESEIRDALLRKEWIYRLTYVRWSNKKQCKVKEYQYRAYAHKKLYFQLVPAHDAPRLNGEVRQTLKLTPAGATAVSAALTRWERKELA